MTKKKIDPKKTKESGDTQELIEEFIERGKKAGALSYEELLEENERLRKELEKLKSKQSN